MNVSILGGNSFLGRNLVSFLQKNHPDVNITTWDFKENAEIHADSEITCFVGMKHLEYAMHEMDVVINLHEWKDLSLLPDLEAMQLHNVEFVRSVVFHLSSEREHPRLVHLSSTFLQCSSRWPNINEPESCTEKYLKQRPFEPYCRTKSDAEELIKSSDVHSYILRCVPTYGKGDDSSTLTDLIKLSSYFDVVPHFGDTDTVMQMAFIDNMVAAIWTSVCSLVSVSGGISPSESIDDSMEKSIMEKSIIDQSFIRETILLADDTKKKDIYTAFGQLIVSEKRPLCSWSIPVVPLFYIYLLFAFCVKLVETWIPMPNAVKELPDPSILYFYFHHWTFFNTLKSYFLLKIKPKYNHEESISACRSYYRCLSAKSVPSFSWKPRF